MFLLVIIGSVFSKKADEYDVFFGDLEAQGVRRNYLGISRN
jgi:hypothetical protein